MKLLRFIRIAAASILLPLALLFLYVTAVLGELVLFIAGEEKT